MEYAVLRMQLKKYNLTNEFEECNMTNTEWF